MAMARNREGIGMPLALLLALLTCILTLLSESIIRDTLYYIRTGMQCDVKAYDDVWNSSHRLTSALLHISSIFSSFLHRMFFFYLNYSPFFLFAARLADLGVCFFFFFFFLPINFHVRLFAIHPQEKRASRRKKK